jgi:hypothetical protein
MNTYKANNDYNRFMNQLNTLNKLNEIDKKSISTPQTQLKSLEVFRKSQEKVKPIDAFSIDKYKNEFLSFRKGMNDLIKLNKYVANASRPMQDQQQAGLFDIGMGEDISSKLNVSNVDYIDYITELRTKLNDVISNSSIVEQLIVFFDNLDPNYIQEFTNNFDNYVSIINKIPQPLNLQRLQDVLKKSIDAKLLKSGIKPLIPLPSVGVQLFNAMFLDDKLNPNFEDPRIIRNVFERFTGKPNIQISSIKALFDSKDQQDINFIQGLENLYNNFIISGMSSTDFKKEVMNTIVLSLRNNPDPSIYIRTPDTYSIQNAVNDYYSSKIISINSPILQYFPKDTYTDTKKKTLVQSVLLQEIFDDPTNGAEINALQTKVFVDANPISFIGVDNSTATTQPKNLVMPPNMITNFIGQKNIIEELELVINYFQTLQQADQDQFMIPFRNLFKALSDDLLSKIRIPSKQFITDRNVYENYIDNADLEQLIKFYLYVSQKIKENNLVSTLSTNDNETMVKISEEVYKLSQQMNPVAPANPVAPVAPVAPVLPKNASTLARTNAVSSKTDAEYIIQTSLVNLIINQYKEVIKEVIADITGQQYTNVMTQIKPELKNNFKFDDPVNPNNTRTLKNIHRLVQQNYQNRLTQSSINRVQEAIDAIDAKVNDANNNNTQNYFEGLGLKKSKKANLNNHIINNKYYVDKSLLDNFNTLELRYLKNKHLKGKPISLTNAQLADLVKKIIYSKEYTNNEIESLPKDEQYIIYKIMKDMDLNVPDNQKFNNEFNMLMGQIRSGNRNEIILQKMKRALAIAYDIGKLSRHQIDKIKIDLKLF